MTDNASVIDAEKIVLGTLMTDPAAVEKVASRLTVGQFHHPRHGTIYRHLLAAHTAGDPADPVALAHRIDAAGDLARVGAGPYLHELVAAVPLADHVDHYVGIVLDAAERRADVEQGSRLIKAAEIADPDQRRQIRASIAESLTGRPDDPPVGHLAQLRAALVNSVELDNIPDPDPLIGEDILFRDCLVWMVGKPGSMKSFTALDMAACVATGQSWQTYPVRQGPVLFLVAEGVRGTKKRVRAWEKSMGRTMTDVYFLPLAVQSKNGAQWEAFVELARELRPALIVLDTQARVTVGVEENSNTEMGEFVHQAERLRIASGACVLVVHHIGRNGDTGRGATVLDGAMSTIIKVTKDDDRVSLECTKNKDGTEWETITLRAVPTDESVVLMLDDGHHRHRQPDVANRKWVREWWTFHEGEPVSVSTLVKSNVVTETTFHRSKLDLIKAGVIVREGTGSSTRYRLCHAPTAGWLPHSHP